MANHVCDVYRPHLIWMVDFKPFKQVRVYWIVRLRFARVLARINGLYAHFMHMIENRLVIDAKAVLAVKNLAYTPVSIEWACRIYLVNVQFHHQVIFRWWHGLVVKTCAVEAKQSCLCRDWQLVSVHIHKETPFGD